MASSPRPRIVVRLGLRSKLMLLTSLVMLFVVSLVVIMVSRNMRNVIQDETLKRSLAIAKSFGANNLEFFRAYSWFKVQQNASNARSDNELAYLVVYNKEGLRVADTEDPHVLAPLPLNPEFEVCSLKRPSCRAKSNSYRTLVGSSERVFDTLVPITASDSPKALGHRANWHRDSADGSLTAGDSTAYPADWVGFTPDRTARGRVSGGPNHNTNHPAQRGLVACSVR